MILGLDISTSYIGWCVFDKKQYIDIGYLDIRKQGNLYEKLEVFEKFIKNFSNLDNVLVEAPLARSNNQNVVNLLQRWNGMCCGIVYQQHKKQPILVEQKSILKEQNIIIPKGVKGLDRKKYILGVVKNLKIIPDSKWANKKTGTPKDFCYDMADACVVALAGLKHEKSS